jgi:hypothetical protein
LAVTEDESRLRIIQLQEVNIGHFKNFEVRMLEIKYFETFMPIPNFAEHGALPPFISGHATDPTARSPYKASMIDVVERFCTSPQRAKLLIGLNAYREHLHAGGFTSGIQWIDGSFVENVELLRKRPPNDIDVVTLFNRPPRYQLDYDSWRTDFEAHFFPNYFDTKKMKPQYNCDTYPVDLDVGPGTLVRNTTYWYGLFSDMRDANTKKGIIEVSLAVNHTEFITVEQNIRGRYNV